MYIKDMKWTYNDYFKITIMRGVRCGVDLPWTHSFAVADLHRIKYAFYWLYNVYAPILFCDVYSTPLILNEKEKFGSKNPLRNHYHSLERTVQKLLTINNKINSIWDINV